MSTTRLILSAAALLTVTACCSQPVSTQELTNKSHFWQRANTTSALYMRGPKAQQMLNRDISRCVTELRELDKLGALRAVTPGEAQYGEAPDPETPSGNLAQWETPVRDGALYAEHLDYHDFETCMMDKGWGRVEHVPYNVSEEAREVYSETILHQAYRTRTGKRDFSSKKSDNNKPQLNN